MKPVTHVSEELSPMSPNKTTKEGNKN